jgi:hypothetical protein
MEDNFIEITSYYQARFRIDQGEIFVAELEDAMVYVCKKKRHYEVHIQPSIGSAIVYEGGSDKFENIFNDMKSKNIKMFVYIGGELKSRKSNILDKFADFLRSKQKDED